MMESMSRQPYAYSRSYYDDHEVYPSIEAFVAKMRAAGGKPWWFLEESLPLTAHYADGTEEQVGIADWVEEVPVDRDEVTHYIDDLREKARKADEEWFAQNKGAVVTGSAPLYMLDREDLINREVESRRWRWKDAS